MANNPLGSRNLGNLVVSQATSQFGGSCFFWLGIAMAALSVLCALFSEVISPYDPLEMRFEERLRPPSFGHLFGTDDFGRDVFSRVIVGSRTSLRIGACSVVLACTAGTILGLMSGYSGGSTDAVIMRVIDASLSFPPILLSIVIMAWFGMAEIYTAIAIGVVFIPRFARLVRSKTLALKSEGYIDAARTTGAGRIWILWKHILPGARDVIMVQTVLAMADAILTEATLSFLGLGIHPPEPSWGAMLNAGQEWMTEAPWIPTFPGLAIFLTVLSLNLVGDGLCASRPR
jgi:peptide/nickel transport system permease protein